MLRNLLLPITAHSLDAPEGLFTPTPPLPPPPPAMATFPALSAKRESEVMYKSSRGQFTPDLTWQSWRADCTGAHSHPLPLPHHALVLQTAPMLTVMHELQYKKKTRCEIDALHSRMHRAQKSLSSEFCLHRLKLVP